VLMTLLAQALAACHFFFCSFILQLLLLMTLLAQAPTAPLFFLFCCCLFFFAFCFDVASRCWFFSLIDGASSSSCAHAVERRSEARTSKIEREGCAAMLLAVQLNRAEVAQEVVLVAGMVHIL